MNNGMNDYGWIANKQTSEQHIAEQYGWIQPIHYLSEEMTCCECGRTFPAPELAGICYCERCVNISCD